MKKNIRHLIQKVDSVSKGNFNETINPLEYKNNLNSLALSIESLQKHLLNHIFELEVVSTQIDNTTIDIKNVLKNQKVLSNDIYESSKKLNDINNLNQNIVMETVELSNQMFENTNALHKSANHLKESSTSSKKNIQKQVDSIGIIISLIQEISKNSLDSANSINKLFESINKISEILTSVQQFYNQTKLLALNATIESAKAGEAGKGFAVVAEEIRKLAENSANSVNEISSLIAEIGKNIDYVISQNNNTNSSIEEAVNHTNFIKDSLKNIEASYIDVEDQIDKITGKIEDNFNLYENISSKISQTSNVSNQVAEEINYMNNYIQNLYKETNEIIKLEINLRDTSESLHSLSDKYKINMLKQVKDKIEQQSQDILKQLTVISNENTELTTSNTDEHKKILDIVKENTNQIEAIWSNSDNGSFIYSNPPAGIENASIREWFNQSINGKNYISNIYISAISKNPCITISVPIINDNGKITGVLGADIGFTNIISL